MGCDIHFHVEIKVNDAWEHYNHPAMPRYYDFFSKIADVRNNGTVEPISQPKGLPEDVSVVTRLCSGYHSGDWHSHSWLSAAEIQQVEEWWKERYPFPNFIESRWGYLFGNSLGGFLEFPNNYPDWLQDVRVVFWFDN